MKESRPSSPHPAHAAKKLFFCWEVMRTLLPEGFVDPERVLTSVSFLVCVHRRATLVASRRTQANPLVLLPARDSSCVQPPGRFPVWFRWRYLTPIRHREPTENDRRPLARDRQFVARAGMPRELSLR